MQILIIEILRKHWKIALSAIIIASMLAYSMNLRSRIKDLEAEILVKTLQSQICSANVFALEASIARQGEMIKKYEADARAFKEKLEESASQVEKALSEAYVSEAIDTADPSAAIEWLRAKSL